ncbi:MAG TPA: hypothetical protein VNF71_02690 [Acidimicrobiales bacterium]|nr:hypothetical protein [Acidimicrobiales bacterium]
MIGLFAVLVALLLATAACTGGAPSSVSSPTPPGAAIARRASAPTPRLTSKPAVACRSGDGTATSTTTEVPAGWLAGHGLAIGGPTREVAVPVTEQPTAGWRRPGDRAVIRSGNWSPRV